MLELLCRDCGQRLPPHRTAGRPKSRCLPCEMAERRARTQRWRLRNPDSRTQSKYGITRAQKQRMLARQGGRCGICGRMEPGSSHGWALDHCHSMDQRDPRSHRGILCHPCNAALGLMRDDPLSLRAAASYIEKHRSTLAVNDGGA